MFPALQPLFVFRNIKRMVNVALIGFGNMGRIVLKILHNKEATIVAVFNRQSCIGQDAGEVIGIGHLGK